MTGITFFMKDNKLNHKTWGGNEREDFKTVINLADTAKSELFFYDVINRKIYYENNSEFSEVGDIIEHAKRFSSPALTYSEKDISNDIIKKKQEIIIEKHNELDNIIDNIDFKDDIVFFTQSKKAFLEKNFTEISENGIDYCMIKPKYEFLNQKRMIGHKKGEQTYILKNKKKIIKKEDNKKKTKSKKKKKKNIKKIKKNNSNKKITFKKEKEKNNITTNLHFF